MPEQKKLAVLTILEPKNAMRMSMDEQRLDELAASMAAIGLLQPIVVKELQSGAYEIVAGHRRYLAARRLGWVEIEARVYAQGELNGAAAMLAENIMREDVNAADEAVWLSDLQALEGWDTIALAKQLHKSQSYVEDRLALFSADEEVFKALRDNKINFSVARELNKFTDEGMRRYHLHQAIMSTPPARLVAQWRQQAESIPPRSPEQTNGAAAEPQAAVQAPPEEGCMLCGGSKDPYNLTYVRIHFQCKKAIEDRIAEAAERG